MKKMLIAFLSIFLLASCSAPKVDSLETQLANDYNFAPLNVELSDYETKYEDSIKSSFLILNCHSRLGGAQIDSTGSGFAYIETAPGAFFIITNNHVVSGAEELFVVTYTGQIVPAELVGIGGKYLDIAVIFAKGIQNCKTANIYMDGDYLNMPYLDKGEEIYALGTPLSINLFGTITKGTVASDKRIVTNSYSNFMEDSYAIQVDVPINPGNSGGPLFNKNGEVVGVNTFKLLHDNLGHNLTGVNFSLPIHDMVIAANYIINNAHFINGYIQRIVLYKPYTLGSGNKFKNVSDFTIKEREDKHLDDTVRQGVYVLSSNNRSIANDSIIVSFDNKEVNDIYDLRRCILEAESLNVKGEIMDASGKITTTTFVLG